MFDFDRWQLWLKDKAVILQASGVDAELVAGGGPTNKPSCSFRIKTDAFLGQFSLWTTGEADFDIMDHSCADFVHHSWGNVLTDDAVEHTFDDFLSRANGLSHV